MQALGTARNFAAALALLASSGMTLAQTAPVDGPHMARLRALAAQPTLASCCKVCSKGKACGDSCIARSKTCHKGVGCACDS